MADTMEFRESGGGWRRFVPYAVALAVAAAIGWFIYSQMSAVQGVRVDAPSPTAIDMLPPPPPLPPPEPVEQPPEPVPETAVPTPSPEPAAAPDAPAPMTIAGDAQAGSDDFGLQAGSGRGSGAPSSAGTCIGPNCGGGGGVLDGFYKRYLSSALQDAIARDNRVNRLVFTADFEITITGVGAVERVRLRRSSGKDDRDVLLQQILEAVSGLDPPPASASRYPVIITVRGRRQL